MDPQRKAKRARRNLGSGGGVSGDYPRSGLRLTYGCRFIGLLAGAFCYLMVANVKMMLGYDDSLDAFGVHGAGGTLGALGRDSSPQVP